MCSRGSGGYCCGAQGMGATRRRTLRTYIAAYLLVSVQVSGFLPATSWVPHASHRGYIPRHGYRIGPIMAIRGLRQQQGVDAASLLDEVDKLQSRAFRELGVLGQPLPDAVLEKYRKEGRLGTGPEREALSKAGEVDDGGSREAMVEALRLRAMAKKLRAEADYAELQLANEKVNATVRAALSGLDVVGLLINSTASAGSERTSPPELDVARAAFSRVLQLPNPEPPPLSTVALPPKEREPVDERYVPGTRPSWIREDLWDDDLPDLSANKQEGGAPRSGDEDASLITAGKRSSATDGKGDLSSRIEAGFIRDMTNQTTAEESTQVEGTSNDRVASLKRWFFKSSLVVSEPTIKRGTNRSDDVDEVYFTIAMNDTADSGLPMLYELEARMEALEGVPDVMLRKIRRREVDPDETLKKTLGAIQELLEANPEVDAELSQPLNLSTGMLSLQEDGDSKELRDQLLEQFLTQNFPETEALGDDDTQTLQKRVFGRDAGGAFTVRQVIDFDGRFNIFLGESGMGPSGARLSSQALMELLERRLEYFNLSKNVSLFILRFPLLAVFDVDDVAMDAVLDRPMDEIGFGDTDMRSRSSEEEEGPEVDLGEFSKLTARFLGKLAKGRFAVLAVSKSVQPNDVSVLSDPVVRMTTAGLGALIQGTEALRHVSAPLAEELDQNLISFMSKALSLPAVTQGVVPALLAFLGLIITHELGHLVAARRNGIKLGAGAPVLNPWLGYLFTFTPFESYPATRQAFFDVSAAGPLLGSALSYVVLAGGLWLTRLGAYPAVAPQIPLPMLQTSVFIAQLTNAVLPGAFATVDPVNAVLQVHPLVLAGLWGVIANAMALLPLGRLDGARMVEALLGKRTAEVASSFTFWAVLVGGFVQSKLEWVFAALIVRVFWHRQVLPCRDEAVDVGGDRVFLGIAGLLLLLGAFIPATDMFSSATYLLNNL